MPRIARNLRKLAAGLFVSAVAVLAVAVGISVYNPEIARAGIIEGGNGGAGSGGGGAGAPYTRNGFGYKKFSVNDNPNIGYTSWADAASTCRNAGFDSVWIGYVKNSSGKLFAYANSKLVGWNNQGYQGRDAQSFVNAKADYVKYGGTNWGSSSKSWFCGGNPIIKAWSTNGHIYVQNGVNGAKTEGGNINVNPGSVVYFSDKVNCSNSDCSSIGAATGWTNTGAPSGSFTGYAGPWGAGSYRFGFLYGVNSGYDHGHTTAQAADAGKKFCRYLSWGPYKNSVSAPNDWADTYTVKRGLASSDPACFTVNYQWSLALQTTVKNTVSGATDSANTIGAVPGDSASWTYQAKQNGPTKTNKTVGFTVVHENGWTGNTSAGSWASGRNPDGSLVTIKSENFSRNFSQDDVGKTFCSKLQASPSSSSSDGVQLSNRPCIHVEYHYPGCDKTKEKCDTTDCTQNGTCPGKETKNGVVPTTGSANTTIQSGETVKFTYSLSNSGPSKSLALEYRAYAFILGSGQNISSVESGPRNYASFATAQCGGRGVATSAQSHCENGVKTATNVVIGSGSGSYPNLGTPYQVNSYDVTVTGAWDAQPGDKICSYLVVNNWSVMHDVAAPTVSASNIKCIEVVKQPQMQIRGSDSVSGAKYWGDQTATNTINKEGGFIGGSYSTSASVVNGAWINRDRGSWSQYGLISNGTTANNGQITNFGAAGSTAFKGTGTGAPNSLANACRLYYSNTALNANGATSTCVNTIAGAGKFANTSRMISLPPAYFSPVRDGLTAIPASAKNADGSINLNSLASGSYVAPANAVINAANLSNSKQIVLLVNGAVTINGNIKPASATFADLGQIPSLTIIAGNMSIKSSVTTLFGTYVANGTLTTCDGGYASGAALGQSGACNQQLTVNGALVTKNSPRFQRTFGGGTDLNNTAANLANANAAVAPAEIVNYTPNLFLTPYYNSTKQDGKVLWQTDSQTSLPARY